MTQNTNNNLDVSTDMEKNNDRQDTDMDDARADAWWNSLATDTRGRYIGGSDDTDVKITLPVAEDIAVDVLKKHLDFIYDREHEDKTDDFYYDEDVKEQDRKLKKALKRVLKYFGESVD